LYDGLQHRTNSRSGRFRSGSIGFAQFNGVERLRMSLLTAGAYAYSIAFHASVKPKPYAPATAASARTAGFAVGTIHTDAAHTHSTLGRTHPFCLAIMTIPKRRGYFPLVIAAAIDIF
jgi:hypothetical protein